MARLFNAELKELREDDRRDNLSRAAVHEAAHSVAIWIQRHKADTFLSCAIWLTDGRSSGATYYRDPQSYSRRQLKAKLLEQCVGRSAEMVFFKAVGFGDDYTNASFGQVDVLKTPTHDESWVERVRLRVQEAEDQTERFVKGHSNLVKKVAVALRTKKTLWRNHLLRLVGAPEATGSPVEQDEEELEEGEIREDQMEEASPDYEAAIDYDDFDDDAIVRFNESGDENEFAFFWHTGERSFSKDAFHRQLRFNIVDFRKIFKNHRC